jgi:hypothetical protein
MKHKKNNSINFTFPSSPNGFRTFFSKSHQNPNEGTFSYEQGTSKRGYYMAEFEFKMLGMLIIWIKDIITLHYHELINFTIN